MNRVLVLIVSLLLILGCSGRDEAHSTELRIVSLAPSVTEMLFALGVGEKVVGVTRFCNHPQEVKLLPKIGGYADPDIEAIVSLEPNAIIGVENVAEQREVCRRLEERGMKTLLIDEKGIEEFYASVRSTGSFCGVPDAAEKLVSRIRTRLDAVRAKALQKKRKVKVLFLCGVDPLVGVGRGSFINELMEIVGAQNALRDERGYVLLDVERIVAAEPDVIVECVMGTEERVKEFWQRYENLIPAVRNRRVLSVDEDLFTRCGPRIADAAEELFRVLYGR